MSEVLARWNALPPGDAAEEILPCCGSKAWAQGMAARRPIGDGEALLTVGDEEWRVLPESAWLEAFRSHPRIGEAPAPRSLKSRSAEWPVREQNRVGDASEDVKAALAEGNRAYEKRFQRIFIVCATGKSAEEIMAILERRLRNDDQTELQEAAEQQRLITRLRLKKWLTT